MENFKVYAQLDYVVDLKKNDLHGYWVLTRFFRGKTELSFKDPVSEELKEKAEIMVIKFVMNKMPDKPLFIRLPVSESAKNLLAFNKNFVVRIHQDIDMESLANLLLYLKRISVKSALDDYTTIGYELSNIRIGAFEYVFFKEDFYTNARRAEIERLIGNFKLFKTIVGFKNIDSHKKLELAISLGADLGVGYFFGGEQHFVGTIE